MKVISKAKNMLEVEIDEDEGFLNVLQAKLLEDSNVELAYYTIPHPLTDKPRVFIRTKKASPNSALKKAVRKFSKEIDDFEKQFKKAVKK